MPMLLKELTQDLRAAQKMTKQEARYLVDMYYQMQDYRIQSHNQVRQAATDPEVEPNAALRAMAENMEIMEKNIRYALDKYTDSLPIGQWLKSICGIGPVCAAGLIAHIDIAKVQTAGQIHAFAGLDPTKEWKKGEKRPHNAKLKCLCWKIGQSFVKVSGNDKDIYGHIIKERKAYEQAKNEAGEYADQAAAMLKKKAFGAETDARKWYEQGMLPPAHIQRRAERYGVKIFLSHLFEVWYEMEHGKKPPAPFAIAILNHAHYIAPPNWVSKP